MKKVFKINMGENRIINNRIEKVMYNPTHKNFILICESKESEISFGFEPAEFELEFIPNEFNVKYINNDKAVCYKIIEIK